MGSFACLVKACDLVKKAIKDALEIFCVPSNLVAWAMKLHTNFEVEVKIGKHKSRFPHRHGVRQGESLAPVLFILVVQLAAETLVVEFKRHNINRPDMKVSVSNKCLVRKHKPNQIKMIK